jgi:DNA ligase-1
VKGWFACEKLDGCRGYWDGSRMWSRSGRVIMIPPTWAAKLPAMHLDGEFFAGRGQWETTVTAVVRNKWVPEVCFIVFDAPEIDGCWSKRIAAAKRKLRCGFAAAVPFEIVNDLVHAAVMFRRIREQGVRV